MRAITKAEDTSTAYRVFLTHNCCYKKLSVMEAMDVEQAIVMMEDMETKMESCSDSDSSRYSESKSEMSDSSMESCSSEYDISSSEPRPVEVSKQGSGRGIRREKGSVRGRGRSRGRCRGRGRGRSTGRASGTGSVGEQETPVWYNISRGLWQTEVGVQKYTKKDCMQKFNKLKISGTYMDTELAHLPFVRKRPGPNVPAACESPFDCFSLFSKTACGMKAFVAVILPNFWSTTRR